MIRATLCGLAACALLSLAAGSASAQINGNTGTGLHPPGAVAAGSSHHMARSRHHMRRHCHWRHHRKVCRHWRGHRHHHSR